ncbi:MAG: KH domain-containing protein [Firmicutes bacterium]|nr:KH domain-containing protein [Bacillota bacterium]
MKVLVELIARSLVDLPDEVHVREIPGERGVTYELSVAPSDVGKVIGKGGRIVKAMRSVVSAAAIQDQKRINIEIV